MENKRGSALIWILIILILLVIGLVVYFLIFDNNIDFRGSTSSGENTGGTDSQSQGANDDDSNGGFFNKDTIPQPPALPE